MTCGLFRYPPVVLTAFIGLLIVLWWVPVSGNPPQNKQPVKVGDAECLDCHDEVAEQFQMNIHWQSAEVEKGYVCESCHGPGSVHVKDEEPKSIFNPATDFLAVSQNPCLNCHKDSKFESISGSAHFEVANGCSDCHTVHSSSEKLLAKSTERLCMECHNDVAAQFRLTSHHPVPEGLMECSSCHEVHGASNQFSLIDSNRELCLSCHAAKEGPFVYEHEPVNEDCSVCHAPHGTVANNLLVQNEPALCMNCHYMHFHTSLTGYAGTAISSTEGEFFEPLNPERTGISTLDAWKSAMLTKCTQCHAEVHGSDLPSQGISSQGRSLTR